MVIVVVMVLLLAPGPVTVVTMMEVGFGLLVVVDARCECCIFGTLILEEYSNTRSSKVICK